jgi:hypothetical protein
VSGVEVGYRFAMIPEWILYHEGLSPLAVRLYGALARHGMDPGTCYPSHARLGRLIGVEEKSIKRPLRQLIEVDAVHVTRRWVRGRRTSNGYRLAGDAPLVYRADERPYSELQPRSSVPDKGAQECPEGEPPNETPTYISTDTQEVPSPMNPELLRRAREKASAMAARRAANQKGTPTP